MLFERVEIADARLTRPYDPIEVARELDGERVEAVDRRGKYLIVRFESGRALVIHLRMTGSLLHLLFRRHRPRDRTGESARETSVVSLPDHLHRRAVVMLDDRSDLVYSDVRRFGTWLLLEPGEVERVHRRARRARSRSRRTSVPGTWVNASPAGAPRESGAARPARAGGRGEHLRRRGALAREGAPADARPTRSTPAEVKALHRAVRRALELGIARQGSTLRDYRLPDGASGEMQHEFKVYGRGGEPCDRCGTPIDKIRVAGRGTWYCPNCQVHRPL